MTSEDLLLLTQAKASTSATPRCCNTFPSTDCENPSRSKGAPEFAARLARDFAGILAKGPAKTVRVDSSCK